MRWLLFLLLSFPRELSIDPTNILFIWNVGQGSWATWVDSQRCIHIDAGGEYSALDAVAKLCLQRKSRFLLSHWDWDHYSFLKSLRRRFPGLCSLGSPNRGRRFTMPRCTSPSGLKIHFHPKGKSLSKNESSLVVSVADYVLLPGDSTRRMERQWSHNLESLRILILGHHGSKTSTSAQLLKRMPNLKLALVSARKSRYGHPHPTVVHRLRRFGIPWISTEDWGSIALELPPTSKVPGTF